MYTYFTVVVKYYGSMLSWTRGLILSFIVAKQFDWVHELIIIITPCRWFDAMICDVLWNLIAKQLNESELSCFNSVSELQKEKDSI